MTAQTDRSYVFERSSDEYLRLTRQAALFEPMTERLFRDAGVTHGMRVLDVGSGVGDVALLAARLVGPDGSVVGVDVDGSALETARARAGMLGLQNVTFIEGDIRVDQPGPTSTRRSGGSCSSTSQTRPRHCARSRSTSGRVGSSRSRSSTWTRACLSRSFPEGTLWDQTGRLVIDDIRPGRHPRAHGEAAFGSFLDAGLPAPAMREEAIVGGGPGFAGYAWLAGVARGLAPLMQKLGIASAQQLDLDTLASASVTTRLPVAQPSGGRPWSAHTPRNHTATLARGWEPFLAGGLPASNTNG